MAASSTAARARRAPVVPLIATLLSAFGVTVLLAGTAWASHGIEGERIAGGDRVATAAEVARATYPNGTATAVVAQAGDYPDALAAAPLARQRGAPVLLTDGDELSAATRDVLGELGVTTAYVVGGSAAVSEAVEAELEHHVESVERIAGSDRYATAAEVARHLAGAGDIELGDRRAAFLATGEGFADALAASSPAAAQGLPILLTRNDALPDVTRQVVADLDVQRVFVLGGSAAVAPGIEEELAGEPLFVTTDRLAGPERTATAAAVAHRARQPVDGGADSGFGYDGADVVLARGGAFADALVAGPLAGRLQAPIQLTASRWHLGDATRARLHHDCPAIERVIAVGGTAALTDAALEDATHCHAGRATQDYTVSPMELITLDPGGSREFRGPAAHDPQFVGAVDVALFPCAAVATDGPSRFADADGDGAADGLGTTDTGSAAIIGIEGQPTHATVLRDVGPTGPGTLQLTVGSEAADCTLPVVFHDANGNGQLDVDREGLPFEFFGFGAVEWTTG